QTPCTTPLRQTRIHPHLFFLPHAFFLAHAFSSAFRFGAFRARRGEFDFGKAEIFVSGEPGGRPGNRARTQRNRRQPTRHSTEGMFPELGIGQNAVPQTLNSSICATTTPQSTTPNQMPENQM